MSHKIEDGLTPHQRWCARNPERAAEHNRNSRWRGILRKHGLTQEDYYAMLAAQGGHCALCPRKPEEQAQGRRHLSVDHCHKTGQVRGLLCNTCNRGLGLLQDDPALLKAGAEYLQRYEL